MFGVILLVTIVSVTVVTCVDIVLFYKTQSKELQNEIEKFKIKNGGDKNVKN